MTPGAALAGARKAAGLSIADAAAQMRLSPRQVQALEADRYEDLPGAVFVRGFIRNYARLLKLDPAPLLQALEPELEDAPLKVQATSGALPARRDHVKPLFVVFCMLLFAVLAAGGYELWSRHAEQRAGSRVDAPTGPRTEVLAPEHVQQPAPAVPAAAGSTQEPAQQPQPESEPAAVASAPVVASEPAKERPAQGARMAQLKVQFADASWLEIRDREGAVVYSGTGQAGSERVFEATAPLSVVIGNASGVRITYNDRALDLSPYAARNIARFTLE